MTIRKDNGDLTGLLVGLVFVACLFVGGALLMLLNSCSPVSKHKGEASWTLQGETSHLDCPGQRPWYVESDGHRFFMGCQ